MSTATLKPSSRPVFKARQTSRRMEIIEAALDQFSAHGYDGATLKDIAEAIGLTHAALYYYYKSKDALLFGAVDLVLSNVLEALQNCYAQNASPKACLRAMITTQLEDEFRNRQAMPLIDSVLFGAHSRRAILTKDQSRQLRKRQKDMLTLYHDTITKGIAQGEFAVDDVRTTIFSIMGMITHAPYWANPKDKAEMSRFIEQQTEVCLRLIG
ncbi:MAG: TetR/AcrR family transcriptional regulator [Pseudomonadota bacterium]